MITTKDWLIISYTRYFNPTNEQIIQEVYTYIYRYIFKLVRTITEHVFSRNIREIAIVFVVVGLVVVASVQGRLVIVYDCLFMVLLW